MSTTESFDEFEKFANEPELVPGDTLFYWWGRHAGPGWKFIGIPGTRFGVSYYVVTGEENEFQRGRLAALVAP